jgi:DNA helicase IV
MTTMAGRSACAPLHTGYRWSSDGDLGDYVPGSSAQPHPSLDTERLRQADDLASEQAYVSDLYARLDGLRDQAAGRLAVALRQPAGSTQQGRSEREAEVAYQTDQVATLGAVEAGLCFGRLDLIEGDQRRYIGRIGLFDEKGDYEPLLLDWRAPAARPFYLATAASPEGVRRRRHIRTKHRTVTSLDDEVLDLASVGQDPYESGGLTSEAALLAAVTANRTGRMRDIVETIQAEQDHIIRSTLDGVLVVQGGPGTGKTAVALHRAAYLLYTYRDLLSTRGVLIVGPNATFLRYISQVLPSLAETGVLLSTVGELFPGVRADGVEPAAAAELKGRSMMADVLAAAIADRQEVPVVPMRLDVDREALTLEPSTVERARARARRSGLLHNDAREVFEDEILDALAGQVAAAIGTDPYADDPLGGDDAPGEAMLLGAADLADIRRDLAAEPQVRAAFDELWPVLTPQRLLVDLFASPDRLAAAAPQLGADERALLVRPLDAAWTPADVPLLDEAVEQLGAIRLAAPASDGERADLLEYARGALEIAYGSRSLDSEHHDESEILDVTDLLDAGILAERHEFRERLTTAERAAADRAWAFGHVIVDEAQELSPMAWRLLMRRCPSRSMTIVGDVAQTGDLAGASSWRAVLEPYVAQRWRLAELSVNYRTPAEVMAVAADVLLHIDASMKPPRSVRESGQPPWRSTARAEHLPAELVGIALKEAQTVGRGRLGLIIAASAADELGRAVSEAMPEAGVGEQADLERRVVVLTVRQAKGLEFDTVVVVDPDRIVAESPRGRSDLYVALTRATQRLGIVTVE